MKCGVHVGISQMPNLTPALPHAYEESPNV